MVCRNCKMELPVYAKYCPSCGMQVHKPHVHHDLDVPKGSASEARARHVVRLLEPAYHVIEARLEDARVDKPELYDTVRRIEAEAVKGADANAAKIGRWLTFLAGLAPDVLAPTVSALLNPEADVSADIRTAVERFSAEPVH